MTDTENLFQGKWTVLGFCIYNPDSGWGALQPYPPEELIWEFVYEDPIRYRENRKTAAYIGRLIKHSPDGRRAVKYAYYPDQRQLFFDASHVAPDGYWNRYRVEKSRGNEYWLHDLEAENDIHDGRYMRLKVKRI